VYADPNFVESETALHTALDDDVPIATGAVPQLDAEYAMVAGSSTGGLMKVEYAEPVQLDCGDSGGAEYATSYASRSSLANQQLDTTYEIVDVTSESTEEVEASGAVTIEHTGMSELRHGVSPLTMVKAKSTPSVYSGLETDHSAYSQLGREALPAGESRDAPLTASRVHAAYSPLWAGHHIYTSDGLLTTTSVDGSATRVGDGDQGARTNRDLSGGVAGGDQGALADLRAGVAGGNQLLAPKGKGKTKINAKPKKKKKKKQQQLILSTGELVLDHMTARQKATLPSKWEKVLRKMVRDIGRGQPDYTFVDRDHDRRVLDECYQKFQACKAGLLSRVNIEPKNPLHYLSEANLNCSDVEWPDVLESLSLGVAAARANDPAFNTVAQAMIISDMVRQRSDHQADQAALRRLNRKRKELMKKINSKKQQSSLA
jgi:hypothetical protein